MPEGECAPYCCFFCSGMVHLLSLRKVLSPGHSGKVRFALHLALPMSYRVTYDQLRKKDVSPLNRSIMKKQAQSTLHTRHPDQSIGPSSRLPARRLPGPRSRGVLDPPPQWSQPPSRQEDDNRRNHQVDSDRPPAHHQGSADVQRYRDHPLPQPPERESRPSASDMNETNKLKKACDIFDISLLDHIIVADKSYYSFAEETQNKF